MKTLALILVAIVAPLAIAAESPPIPARVVTDDATRKSCQYLGLVTVHKSAGRDKAGGALKKALTQTAKLGGNGLFLIGQSQNWIEGASVSGEALKCPDAAFGGAAAP